MLVEKALMIRFANKTGVEILPDNAVWTNRFNVRSSSSNRFYTVAQRKTDGIWGCDCMGWKRHRNCKHLTAMMPVLKATISAPKQSVR